MSRRAQEAGALTLLYLASPMDRGTLLALLAEATTSPGIGLDETDWFLKIAPS